MSYKLAITCGISSLRELRHLSTKGRKSKELWEEFKRCSSLVSDSEFVTRNRIVEFATVIRSVNTNRLITHSCGSRCAVITREPVKDEYATFDDVCIANAYAAYTRSVLSDDLSLLARSTMQSMGIVFYSSRPIVYMNVLVQDEVFSMIESGLNNIRIPEYCSVCSIQEFNPISGSIEDLISDSFVVVGGDK